MLPACTTTGLNLDLPVSIGGYECAQKPEEPIVVHMMKAACHPGLPARQQHTFGRMELYTTTFETMERKIREQLARTLGPGRFRSRARYCGHHGQPLATRIRLRIQLAV